MSKNANQRATSATHKKGSYSHESSPLHTYKPKKDTNNCFQPSELDTNLKLSSKVVAKKAESRPLTANVFINNLNVQMNSSQVSQKKTSVPLSASITNRKSSKQYSALTQKEEAALAAFREGKSKQKLKGPQTSFDEAMGSSGVYGGASYDLRKTPLTLVSRHNSEASNDLARNSYIPKFKGSDPSNKFALRSPPKVFSQSEAVSTSTTATKFKKPNVRGTQKSFDVNAGPLNKYNPYLNTYLRPTATANSSPKNKDSEAKMSETGVIGRGHSSTAAPKSAKISVDKHTATSKSTKSTVPMSKHRKTPSFDATKRNDLAQKTLTPPMLDRMRKSADCGDYWQGNLEIFNNTKQTFQFAIRTRAGVAPNGTRKINQDSFIFHTNYGKKSDRYLLGVCDGHGMNGHLVSGFVKEALPIYILADPSFESDIDQAMTNAFELCHQKLLVGDVDCRFSGTTTAVVMIEGNKVFTANAGDSRAIIGSYGNKGWDYTPITFDHKPDTPQEAHRIIKSGGRIEPFKDLDGGFVGPSRVWLANQDIPGLAMSRSIGDFVAASVGVSCIPEIKEFTINPNDRFMIVASDGVWEFIENIDIVKIIAPFYEQNNIEGACDFLLGVALKRWQEEEEVVVDDITLIMVFF